MRILHSADWHLDSPMQGHSPQMRAMLRQKLLEVPGQIAELCRKEDCDLVLLAGDLFDGSYTPESCRAVYDALRQMEAPVFISPGNHDFISPDSPWEREVWPENVYIFTRPQVESVGVSSLNCRVYGAGFTEKDCPALLAGFQARQEERYAVGIFHGDPTQVNSPYNPITSQQVQESALSYLALGHIHKADCFRAGNTMCAWPGCPMGTGFDEQGIKGVYIVDVEEEVSCRFVSLDVPKFYDLEVAAGADAAQSLAGVMPGSGNADFYRVTFTGESDKLELEEIQQAFSRFPNLLLRDKTIVPVDIWAGAGEDSFEGVYFGMLKAALNSVPEEEKEKILLAAKLSRAILNGEEVVLP